MSAQDFRYLHWPCLSRRNITLCWDSEICRTNILLVLDNRNGFLGTLYCVKRDFEARKCTERASGQGGSKSLEVSFSFGGRSCKIILKCRTEFVLRACDTPRTTTNSRGKLCRVYVVTAIYLDTLPELKCVIGDLGTYSDIWDLWFNKSSNNAAALLENNNTAVCVGRGGLLLVLASESATLDPSNFSLFSFRPPAMDLTTAYRYNQNMMEYYTCKSKS